MISYVIAASATAVLICMLLAIVRACLGPTAFDRLLATNLIGTLTMILIAVYGFLTERPEFLDLAIVYALINLVGTIAVLKFFRYKDLGAASSKEQLEEGN